MFSGISDWIRAVGKWIYQTIFFVGCWYLLSQVYWVTGLMVYDRYGIDLPKHDYMMIGEPKCQE